MKNTLGAEIRKRRKALNITLEELGLRVNDHNGNLSKIERGLLGVSDEKLRAIAYALGCTVAEIYAATEDSPLDTTPIGAKRIPILSQDEFNNTSSTKSLSSSKYLACDLGISDKAFALNIDDAAMLNDFKKK